MTFLAKSTPAIPKILAVMKLISGWEFDSYTITTNKKHSIYDINEKFHIYGGPELLTEIVPRMNKNSIITDVVIRTLGGTKIKIL